MKSAVMIRKTKPISLSKLPDRSGSEKFYEAAMEQSAKAEAQAVLDTGKVYGPMSEQDQIEAIFWAYGVQVIQVGGRND